MFEASPVILLIKRYRTIGVFLLLALTLAVSPPKIRGYGHNLQIAVPLIGRACAATNGQAIDYFVRFAVMNVILHGAKRGLGEAAINHLPNGGIHGFPSGHSAASAFGASYLFHQCVGKNLAVRATVAFTALFVAGSRVQSGAHTVIQVLAGLALGFLADRAFRVGVIRLSRRRRNRK
jgi:membrane-associated phospholipid phosphatase